MMQNITNKKDSVKNRMVFFNEITTNISQQLDAETGTLIDYIYELGGKQKEVAKRLNKTSAAVNKKNPKRTVKEVNNG